MRLRRGSRGRVGFGFVLLIGRRGLSGGYVSGSGYFGQETLREVCGRPRSRGRCRLRRFRRVLCSLPRAIGGDLSRLMDVGR